MALLPRDLQERYNRICSKIFTLNLPETHFLIREIDDIDERDYIKDPQGSIVYLEQEYSKLAGELQNTKESAQSKPQTIQQELPKVDSTVLNDNCILNQNPAILNQTNDTTQQTDTVDNFTNQKEVSKLNTEITNDEFSIHYIEQLLSSIISDSSRCKNQEGAVIKQKAQELLQEYNNIYDVTGAEDYKEEIKNKAESLKNKLNGIMVRYVSEEEAKAYGEWGED